MQALIVVDVQNDFCEGGSLAVPQSAQIIPVVNRMIALFAQQQQLVVATKDWHPANHKSFAINSNGKVGELGELNGLPQIWWPAHCVQHGPGAEFHPELLPIAQVIYKGDNSEIDSYSGFFDNGKTKATELDALLKKNKVDRLYVLGLATDYCVKYTVLDALELGYDVALIVDGCRGVNITADDTERAIAAMQAKGAEIITSAVVAESMSV